MLTGTQFSFDYFLILLPNMGKQGKWIPGIHFPAIKHGIKVKWKPIMKAQSPINLTLKDKIVKKIYIYRLEKKKKI
jgi:hypothetical protein